MGIHPKFQLSGPGALRAISAGAGLKHEHADDIFGSAPQVEFFEVHAENYMGAGGPPHHLSTASGRTIRCRFTVSGFRSGAQLRSIAITCGV